MILSRQNVMILKIYDYNGRKNLCGTNVRRLRREKGMTQDMLSQRLQLMGVVVERFAVAKIEAGTRFVADYELYALAEIFGVQMEDLMKK